MNVGDKTSLVGEVMASLRANQEEAQKLCDGIMEDLDLVLSPNTECIPDTCEEEPQSASPLLCTLADRVAMARELVSSLKSLKSRVRL